ncbi:putative porin [Mucilaginibacter sp. BT774]|uniref:putative porin n=1 Tax=Mucilaginibacter sp. BT774 TaxID=3062276 RepID=UPI002676F62C|nr:putative porin [Mucilaginibacter sp. BT774]MDO3627388.1 putative porin [Mucilaginibacter sp. BT774]
MHKRLRYILLVMLICFSAGMALAQTPNIPGYPNNNIRRNNFNTDTATNKPGKQLSGDAQIDAERQKEEKKRDSVIFTSKFIRVTNERLLSDSTQVFPLDTGLVNFENYSPLYQPRSPKIGLGNLGLAERSLLFEPSKTIGFDVGQHFLDAYLFTPQDIQYYKARVPYTNLSLFASGVKEQMFKVLHTQNINPQLNVGFNLNFIGSHGFYPRQAVSDLTGAIFSWYESKSKRYNLLASYNFNNLKAPENGSIQNDSIYTAPATSGYVTSQNQPVRLYNSSDNIRNNGFYIKQFYYIGKIDTTIKSVDKTKILPTQRVSYTLYYNKNTYKFLQNEPDTYGVFPDYYYSSTYSRDSLSVFHLQNGFSYSFYLRGKSTGIVKNEVKVDLGLVHDYYKYQQYVTDTITNANFSRQVVNQRVQNNAIQDITLKAKAGYRFSNRILLDVDLQQIAAGRDFGNFLYEAKLSVSGGQKAGRIILGAYQQSSSPPLVYTDWISNHFIFHNSFSNQKTTNLSFNYINDLLKLDLKAEYYLINDYLYFTAEPNGIDATPTQLHNPINLIKLSLGKNLSWRRWHFDNYVVYQKSDYQNTLRTPSVYTYSSLYYSKLLFSVLNSNFGINVRYNTPYVAPSYAVGLGQFYNSSPNLTFSSYPVASVFFKATLIRTNIFVTYDYANQGIFSKGYYMVNRYPGPDHLLKIGVSWSFYN